MTSAAWIISPILLFAILQASATSAAAGFSGDFAAEKWETTINNLPECVDPEECFAFDGNRGIINGSTARVNLSGEGGTVSVEGEDPEEFVSLSAWTNSPQPARSSPFLVTFNLQVILGEFDNSELPATGYFRIGSGLFEGNIASDPDPKSFSLILGPTDSLSFGIYTNNVYWASPGDAYLQITNFSTVPVIPAPLPALGAASLLLGSRRLRRRIRQKRYLAGATLLLGAPAVRSVLPQ